MIILLFESTFHYSIIPCLRAAMHRQALLHVGGITEVVIKRYTISINYTNSETFNYCSGLRCFIRMTTGFQNDAQII